MMDVSRPRDVRDAAPVGTVRVAGIVRRRRRAGAVLSLAVASALMLAGCGGQAGAGKGTGPAAGKEVSRTYTIEQLAAEVGCTATITLKALDYRQGECTSDGIPYVFLDFATATGQREWLDYAEMYGGLYLRGDRWVLSAKSKSFMQELSGKLGGTVEEDGGHSGHNSHGASASPSSTH
ncbi:hypothetical protein AB0K18_30255 [Nonomuraea sp. NPDC049421]|uniref:hypothetical protein n=1 Tax=Nonomuraea sp. NPDC049421 TaxID=3155275 RepID=UPI0034297D67